MITHDSDGGHSDLWDYIDGNSERTGDLEERVSKLESLVAELQTRLHDHEQAVPHAAAQS